MHYHVCWRRVFYMEFLCASLNWQHLTNITCTDRIWSFKKRNTSLVWPDYDYGDGMKSLLCKSFICFLRVADVEWCILALVAFALHGLKYGPLVQSVHQAARPVSRFQPHVSYHLLAHCCWTLNLATSCLDFLPSVLKHSGSVVQKDIQALLLPSFLPLVLVFWCFD